MDFKVQRVLFNSVVTLYKNRLTLSNNEYEQKHKLEPGASNRCVYFKMKGNISMLFSHFHKENHIPLLTVPC